MSVINGTRQPIAEPQCVKCGREINEYNSRKSSTKWYDALGTAHYCLACQQEYFDALAQTTTYNLAYFYCCIAFNVPFVYDAIPTSATIKDLWIEYIDTLRRSGEGIKGKKYLDFFDGETDITKIFGGDSDAGTFLKYTAMDTAAKVKLPGTQKQREAWGTRTEKHPYTDEDYKKLDAYFKAYGARLESAGGPDMQQEETLRLCSKLKLEMEDALNEGKIDKAQKYNKVIQDNLAAENLRKRDAKPIEDMRLDSIVDALERKGYAKNGKLLSYDKLLNKLRGDVPKYRYTKDAADQILLYIINTIRANDGLSEYGTLPKKYRLDDHGGEFAEEPNADEKEAYEKMGIVRMTPLFAEKKDTNNAEG